MYRFVWCINDNPLGYVRQIESKKIRAMRKAIEYLYKSGALTKSAGYTLYYDVDDNIPLVIYNHTR